MSSSRRILKYVTPYKYYILASIICTILAAVLQLGLTVIVRDFTDKVVGEGNLAALNLIIFEALIIVLGKNIFSYGQIYLMSYAGQRVVTDLRKKMFEHIQRLSLDFYAKWKTGELISRIMNDVNVLQTALVNQFIYQLLQAMLLLGVLIYAFMIHWKLALISFMTMPFLAYALARFGNWIRRVGMQNQMKLGDISSLLQEKIAGIRIVKAFVMEDKEIEKFSEEVESNFNFMIRRTKLFAAQVPVVGLIATLGVTVIVWYGGYEVVRGSLTLGKFLQFITCLAFGVEPINSLSRVYGVWQATIPALDRIFEIMDITSEVEEKPDSFELPSAQGEVDFQNISFSFNGDDYVLRDVNLKVSPGEVIALVGPSGAGKTTTVNLIPRFYDPTKGRILIDGVDIREVKLYSLRRQIGIVPQETILFSGTIRDNIAYGKPEATDREIREAAKAANAHEFIMNLEGGYEARVGERGVNLSGGQRQRIAIARAILLSPRFLILDEATSSLDTQSEDLVQEALSHLMKGRTTFIIAHRLSTVIDADRIIVLDGGRIVEMGSHRELINRGGLYSELYRNQFLSQEKEQVDVR